MAAVNANEIELAYEAAMRLAREENDGRLDAVTEMALQMFATVLLESLKSEQERFQHAAERRVTQAEEIITRIQGDG